MMFGIARAGMTVLPLNPMSTANEIAFQMDDVGATILLSDGELSVTEVIAAGRPKAPDIEVDENSPFWARFYLRHHRQAARVHCVQPVAGAAHATTGRRTQLPIRRRPADQRSACARRRRVRHCRPGGRVHNRHRAVVRPGHDLAGVRRPRRHRAVRGADHAVDGARQPRYRSVDPPHVCLGVNTAAGTGRQGVGPVSRDRPDRAVRRVGIGHDHRAARSRGRRPGSVGLPRFGNSVKILDDDGNPLPPGEIGTVYVQGPSMSDGFIGSIQRRPMPSATAG